MRGEFSGFVHVIGAVLPECSKFETIADLPCMNSFKKFATVQGITQVATGVRIESVHLINQVRSASLLLFQDLHNISSQKNGRTLFFDISGQSDYLYPHL